MEYYLIQGTKYSKNELQQAESLIFKGKTYATRGDPRLSKLVNTLLAKGYKSAGQYKRDYETVFTGEGGFSVKPENREALIEQRKVVEPQPIETPKSEKVIYADSGKANVNIDIRTRYVPDPMTREQKFRDIQGTEYVVGYKKLQPDVTKQPSSYKIPKRDYQDVNLTDKEEIELDKQLEVENKTRQGTISTFKEIPDTAYGQKFYIEEPSYTEKLREKSFVEYSKGNITGAGAGFIAGVGASLKGTIIGTTQLLTDPLTTIGGTIQAIPQAPKKISNLIKQEPYFLSGYVAGELAQFKAISLGQKGILKGVDIYRTRGMTEIPFEDVIAKEVFEGQKYPQVRKGQTAGELLKEFRAKLPDETKPAGYTASPKPLKATGDLGEIKTLRGRSELPALYQSPDLNPEFLKISGERKLFSFNILGESVRPTSFRITPTSFELMEGVSAGQKGLTNIGRAREFFERAEKGKSYIPYIKYEKESLIPFDTELLETNKRFYFKYEGRRIPIYEYETVGGKPSTKQIKNQIKKYAEDLTSESYKVGKSSYINPSQSITIIKPSYSKPSKQSTSSIISNVESRLNKSISTSTPSLSKSFSSDIKSYSYNPKSSKSILSSLSSNVNTYSSSFRPTKSTNYYGYGDSRDTIKSTYKIPIYYNKDKRLFNTKETYNVLVKRRGKYVPIATDLTRGKAKRLLSNRLQTEISRTGKLVKSGRKKEIFGEDSFELEKNIFRDYKIRKGKKIKLSDEYIQRTSANLQNRQERYELAQARRLKKLLR